MALNTSGLKPPWQKGQSGNPAGSKKSRVNEALAIIFKTKKRCREFYKMTQPEIDSWDLTLLSLTTEETKSLVKWDACPNYAKGLAIAILSDMKDGRTTTLDRLRARQFGDVVQRVDVSGSILQGVVNITIEEATKIIDAEPVEAIEDGKTNALPEGQSQNQK